MDDTKVTPEVTPEVTPTSEPTVAPTPDFESKFNELTQKLESIEEKIKAPEATSTPAEDDYKFDSWKDVISKVEEISDKKAEEKLTAWQQKQEDEKKAVVDRETAINSEFDNQLTTLETKGRIPKVENPNKDDDPGVIARKELFALGVEYKSVDLEAMANLRDKIKPTPSGVAAPVGSSSRATAPTNSSNKYDYAKDRGKSVDKLTREYFGESG